MRVLLAAIVVLAWAVPVAAQVDTFTMWDNQTFAKIDWESTGSLITPVEANTAETGLKVIIEYHSATPECSTTACSYTINAVLEELSPTGSWIPVAQDTRPFGQPSGNVAGPIRELILNQSISGLDSGSDFSFTDGVNTTAVRSFHNGSVDDDFRVRFHISGVGTATELTALTLSVSGYKQAP